jgi:hypothetical protein
MRVMVLVKATEESERSVMPTSEEFAEMGRFNDELLAAGVMLAADGLAATSRSKRVEFDESGSPTVIDGPFAETKELAAGFWIWEVSSLDEAVEWIKRAPFRPGVVELRPFITPEDLGEIITPEIREDWDRQRAATEL